MRYRAVFLEILFVTQWLQDLIARSYQRENVISNLFPHIALKNSIKEMRVDDVFPYPDLTQNGSNRRPVFKKVYYLFIWFELLCLHLFSKISHLSLRFFKFPKNVYCKFYVTFPLPFLSTIQKITNKTHQKTILYNLIEIKIFSYNTWVKFKTLVGLWFNLQKL